MGWHKTSVEGRTMWESPDGQRVTDPADIPEFRKHPRDTVAPIQLEGVGTFLVGVLLGLVIGLIVGVTVW